MTFLSFMARGGCGSSFYCWSCQARKAPWGFGRWGEVTELSLWVRSRCRSWACWTSRVLDFTWVAGGRGSHRVSVRLWVGLAARIAQGAAGRELQGLGLQLLVICVRWSVFRCSLAVFKPQPPAIQALDPTLCFRETAFDPFLSGEQKLLSGLLLHWACISSIASLEKYTFQISQGLCRPAPSPSVQPKAWEPRAKGSRCPWALQTPGQSLNNLVLTVPLLEAHVMSSLEFEWIEPGIGSKRFVSSSDTSQRCNLVQVPHFWIWKPPWRN